MGLIALAVALLLEELRPPVTDNALHRAVRRLADLAREHSSTGRTFDAALAWAALVGGSVLLVLALEWFAATLGPVVSFLLHVAILYQTVGLRRSIRALRSMLAALERDDEPRAADVLAGWCIDGREADASWRAAADDDDGRARVCRAAITHGLLAAHRELIGPILAYLLLPGAIGPVAYRLIDLLACRWRPGADDSMSVVAGHSGSGDDGHGKDDADWAAGVGPGDEPHAEVAARALRIADWIPLRVTAAGLAIAGDFEDATYCWRSAMAAGLGHCRRAMLAAVGGGALGVELLDRDDPLLWEGGEFGPEAFDWQGTVADVAAIRSTIGLIWRTGTLLAGLFVLVSLASWLGS